MNMQSKLLAVIACVCLLAARPASAIEYSPEVCNGGPVPTQQRVRAEPSIPTSADVFTICYQGYEYADYASIQLDGNQLTVTIFDNGISWSPNPAMTLGQRVGPLAPGDYQLTVILTEEKVLAYGYPLTVASKVPLHVAAAPFQPDSWVVEYYNRTLDHYFMTSLASEMAVLDASVLKGWQRTGYAFKVSTGSASQGVCRFYIPPGYGDSHFYSASSSECTATSQSFPWLQLETDALFRSELPNLLTGICSSGLVPVYRMWNRRADSNHRYTTDAYVRKTMKSAGYVPEGYGADGVVMCTPK